MRKERIVVYGVPALDEVETTDVENFNGILSERIGRLVRRTKCFCEAREEAGLCSWFASVLPEFY